MADIDNERLFNDPQYKKLREAWCAAMFGVGYEKCVGPCFVAVNDTNDKMDVDFFVKVDDWVFPFQLTEAMEPARRRGLEYRQIARGDAASFPYEPEKGRQQGPLWILEAVKRKADKHYAGAKGINLLVYVNFAAHQLHYPAVVEAVSQYANSFASIWTISDRLIGTIYNQSDLRSINGWGVIFSDAELLAT